MAALAAAAPAGLGLRQLCWLAAAVGLGLLYQGHMGARQSKRWPLQLV